MQTIDYGYLRASKLGIGASTFGSRLGEKDAVGIMGALFDQGVNYFDTSPAYGLGQSESILGRFCKNRRERCYISTKIGTISGKLPIYKKMLLPVARALRDAPLLKNRLNRQSATFYSHKTMTVDEIEASLQSSLKALQTEYIDQLLLHNYIVEHISNPAFCEKIQSFKEKGLIRKFGISVHGLAPDIEQVLGFGNLPIDTIQLPFKWFPDPVGFKGHTNYFSLFSGAHGSGFIDIENKIKRHKQGHFIVSMSTIASVERNIRMFSQ